MDKQLNGGLLVIKASAGSGKTYTLAKLYITQLLFKTGSNGKLVLRNQPDYHRHILAITFTNKATDEMKSRIVKELYILAQDAKQSDYFTFFAENCTADAIEGLQKAAHDALVSILFNYSDFAVSTIDSFFQSILRRFARELDRDYNYEIQIDADFAISAAVHSFLLALGRDIERTGKKRSTSIEQWVREIIRNKVEENENWNFFNGSDLTKIAKYMNQETFSTRMDDLRSYLSQRNDDGTTSADFKRIHAFQQMLIKARNYYKEQYTSSYTGKMRDIINRHGIDEDMLKKNQPLYTFLLADKMALDDSKPSESLRATCLENIASKFNNKYTPSDDAAGDILRLIADVCKSFDLWMLTDKMAKDIGKLGLIGAIDEKLEDYRKDSNTILIADTNQLISHIIGKDHKSSVPFIYERTGTWINHYMIDEFQDTSLKQYQNFMPLLYESLSHSDDNFNMIIGDAKQSIYRFRNADPAIFRDLINNDFKNNGLHFDKLPTNYRSLPEIIKFNNQIFKQIINRYAPAGDNSITADIVRRTYMPENKPDDYQQLTHAKEPDGFVRIVGVDTNGEPINSTEQVLEMLPDYLLKLHSRYDWKHIGILVNRKEEGNQVISAILNHNLTASPTDVIEITSDESMLLKNSSAVRRVISMLRFIDLVQYKIDDEDSDDDIAKQAINGKSGKRRLNEGRLYRALSDFIAQMALKVPNNATETGEILAQSFNNTAHQENTPITDIINQYAQLMQQLLPDERSHMFTLSSIVEHIIACIGDDSTKRETTFLLALQDCVAAFQSTSAGGTIREFLRYWDQCKDKLTVASATTGDSIRIMTIHKSKGLEFECVVLPFVNWSITSNLDYIYWMPDNYWHAQEAEIAHIFNEVPGVEYNKETIPPLLPIHKAEGNNIRNSCGLFAPFIDQQKADTLIDNLNKTYVAFTRPREELHIFAFTKKPEGKTPKVNPNETAGQMVMRLARELEGESPAQALGTVTQNIERGKPRQIHKSKCQDPDKEPNSGEQNIESQSMPPYFATKSPVNLQVKLPQDVSVEQERGIRLHNFLSRIGNKRDADKALRFATTGGIIEQEGEWNETQVRNLLKALFTHPVTATWWDDENTVYTERSIVSNTHDIKRPDRVVRRPDGTMIVIDYKFGEPHKAHHRQVAHYMEQLSLMGNELVQGFLLYLKPDTAPTIVEVPASGNR